MFYTVPMPKIGVELYLASKFSENAMYGLVQFARYISALIEFKYGTSGSYTHNNLQVLHTHLSL